MERKLVNHLDKRGSVTETWRESWGTKPIKQMTLTRSVPNTFRGMHYHRKQTDIWTFIEGSALVVLYDPYKQDLNIWEAAAGTGTFIIPPGIAHGALSLTATALLYGLTEEYDGSDEYGFKAAAILPAKLMFRRLILSDRDTDALSLDNFLELQHDLDIRDQHIYDDYEYGGEA